MTDDLLSQIEAALTATGISASRFGFDALGERQLVFQLRAGREPRRATRDKILAHIARILSAPPAAPPEAAELQPSTTHPPDRGR